MIILLEKTNSVIYNIPNGVGSVLQYAVKDAKGEISLVAKDPGKNIEKTSIVKLWYHHNRLGSTDYLSDNVAGKPASYVTYDDWGAPTAKVILKMGVRELDLVTEYTVHPYDQVLDLYFAQARMYDASDRRFTAMDPARDTMNLYQYCLNNPISFVDPLGLWYVKIMLIRNWVLVGQITRILFCTWKEIFYARMAGDTVMGFGINRKFRRL